MTPGPLKPRPQGSAKAAVTDLVSACGGYERAAEYLVCSRSTVHRWTDPQEAVLPGLGQVAMMERLAGRAVVTEWLAREAVAMVLPLPGAGPQPLAGDIAMTGAEVARLLTDYAASIADGTLSADEGRRLLAHAERLLMAAGAAWSQLAEMVRRGEGRP